jgi:hypothetical protein
MTVLTSFLFLFHTTSSPCFPRTEHISVTSRRGITVLYGLGFFQSCVIRISVFWDETLRRWVRSSRRFERRFCLSVTSPKHRNFPNSKLPGVPNWLLRNWTENFGMIVVINLTQTYRLKKLDRPGNLTRDLTVNFHFITRFGRWFFIVVPCILITSKSFIHQQMHYLLILENSKLYIKT